MISLILILAIFTGIYLVVGILGLVFKLTFGLFKASFGIAVFIGALILKLVFFTPLIYAIIWALVIYGIIRLIGGAVHKA